MNKIIALGLVGFFTACGGSPCQEASDNAQACQDTYLAEAAGDHTIAIVEALQEKQGDVDACADDDGSQDEYYTCVSAAYLAGDCSTQKDYASVVAAVIACDSKL